VFESETTTIAHKDLSGTDSMIIPSSVEQANLVQKGYQLTRQESVAKY